MSLGQQPVEDRVGDRRVADPAVPLFDGQLMRDDRRPLTSKVLDDLEEVGARRRIEAARAPIVENQDIGSRQVGEPVAERAARMQNPQLLGQARHAQVERAVAAPAGVLRQGAAEPSLADAGRTAEQDRVAALDPAREGRTRERLAVEPADVGEVGVLDAGAGELQSCPLQQARALAVGSGGS